MVYFIVAFVLIFLTSSFVIEDVYNNADKLLNPTGVQAIYESTIGKAVDQEDGGNPTHHDHQRRRCNRCTE